MKPKTIRDSFSSNEGRKTTNDFHAAKIKRMLGDSEKEARKEESSGHVTDPIVTPKESEELSGKKEVSGEARALSSRRRLDRVSHKRGGTIKETCK